jgi:hypothetical protein
MRTKRLAAAAGYSGLLLCLLVSTSAAQERARQNAPIVRVYSENGAGVVSSYVRPAIHVSEDAYLFAVMIDLDGHIQVLHPDFPGISVRIQSRKLLHLPNFFAGFNDQRVGSRYSLASSSYTRTGSGLDDSRGTVIALASRAPFNLELIEADGDWNMTAIRRIIEYRSPEAAAQMLAQYLGAKGEPVGRDYMRFAGGRQSYYAYSDLDYCGYGGYNGYGALAYYARFAELRASGLRPVIIGYDRCGIPLIVAATVGPNGGFRPLPVVRPPKDTTIFPKSHYPQGTIPRPVAEGVFPIPQRSGLQQIRDVTITAPSGRRAEPREILEQFRSQPGASSMPERARTPIDRTTPTGRTESAATGGMRPTYRPEPRVNAPSEPVRVPERAREPAPAPVVHERPSQPSAPAPRAEPVAHSKPEPVTTPQR